VWLWLCCVDEFKDLRNTVVTLEVKLGIATMGGKVNRQTVYQIKGSLASANGQLDDLQFEVSVVVVRLCEVLMCLVVR
jgi:hypothetical protein